MESLVDLFGALTARTASSTPWFTRYSASYRCAFSMTERPFSGKLAASSEVDRYTEARVLGAVESRCGRTNGFSWTELRRRVGDPRGGIALDWNQIRMVQFAPPLGKPELSCATLVV